MLRAMSELTSREEPATATTSEPTCRWEYESGQQCTRSPAPRRGTRGPAPVYCEQADGPGQPVHNPLNAWRAKTRPAGAEDADPQAGRAPVTEAVRTAGNTLDRAEQLAAALRETAEHLAEALATATDPAAAEAQISARVVDAEEEADQARATATRETAARLAAETRAEEARQMAEAMAGQAETAQADAEAARADASSARAELRDRIIEHEEARQAIRREADEAINRARADADERISAAETDKAAAIAEAAQRASRAEVQAREAIGGPRRLR
jgi:colicin import membrane protein